MCSFDRPLDEDQITREMVVQLLDFDADTGIFRWKHRPDWMFSSEPHARRWNKSYAGRVAGTATRHGYLVFRMFGRLRKAHRIAFLVANGHWPVHQVDHVNGSKADNRPSNLRDVLPVENMRNRKLNANASSGVPGVYWASRRQKWRAHIKDRRQNIHLGYFDDINLAISARKAAEAGIGFHANHGRKEA